MTRRFTVMRMWRERQGLTQAQLADWLGVTQPRISLWESGVEPIPERHQATLSQLWGVEASVLAVDALVAAPEAREAR